MKYYTIDEKEENILIYEYNALADKLYQYKKQKMTTVKHKFLKASLLLKNGVDYRFKDNEFNVTNSNNIDRIFLYSDTSSLLEEEQKELLEKFYCGELIFDEKYKFNQATYDFFRVSGILPKEIRVKKNECHPTRNDEIIYYTNDVIGVPKSLMILNDLENGDLNSIARNIEELDGQLECFQFSKEPVDSIKIDTLRVMYGNKYINTYDYGSETSEVIDYTIEQAKENQKVLQLIKNS